MSSIVAFLVRRRCSLLFFLFLRLTPSIHASRGFAASVRILARLTKRKIKDGSQSSSEAHAFYSSSMYYTVPKFQKKGQVRDFVGICKPAP